MHRWMDLSAHLRLLKPSGKLKNMVLQRDTQMCRPPAGVLNLRLPDRMCLVQPRTSILCRAASAVCFIKHQTRDTQPSVTAKSLETSIIAFPNPLSGKSFTSSHRTMSPLCQQPLLHPRLKMVQRGYAQPQISEQMKTKLCSF